MFELIIQIFVIFGGAYVVGFSKISLGFREWLSHRKYFTLLLSLIECAACFSWHAGFWLTCFGRTGFKRDVYGVFSAAFFFAATSYILARLTGLMPAAEERDEYLPHEDSPELHVTDPALDDGTRHV